MAVTLTLAANARSSVPTEHPGKISSGPTILFGVPGITGHTICRTLYCKTANGIQIRIKSINTGTFGTNYMSTNYKYIKNDT